MLRGRNPTFNLLHIIYNQHFECDCITIISPISLITAGVKWNYSYSLMVLYRIQCNQHYHIWQKIPTWYNRLFYESFPSQPTFNFMEGLSTFTEQKWVHSDTSEEITTTNPPPPTKKNPKNKLAVANSDHYFWLQTGGEVGRWHQSETVLWCEFQSFCSTVYEVPFFCYMLHHWIFGYRHSDIAESQNIRNQTPGDSASHLQTMENSTVLLWKS